MKVLKLQVSGNTSVVIGSMIAGLILLFVSVYMLSTIEPIFEGRLTQCSFANTAPGSAVTLNGTSGSGSTSANITFATVTNQEGSCHIMLNVSNVSATAGSYLEVRYAGSLGLLENITIPAAASQTNVTGVTHSSGNFLANYTAFGGDNVTLPTGGTYIRCCASLVSRAGPAGQHYNNVVAMIATIFAVIGVFLIIVALSVAFRTMKEMF